MHKQLIPGLLHTGKPVGWGFGVTYPFINLQSTNGSRLDISIHQQLVKHSQQTESHILTEQKQNRSTPTQDMLNEMKHQ